MELRLCHVHELFSVLLSFKARMSVFIGIFEMMTARIIFNEDGLSCYMSQLESVKAYYK